MESSTISDIIRYASNVSVLLPLGIYLTKIEFAPRRVHLIGGLLFVSAIADVMGYIRFSDNEPTSIVFNIYYILMFILLAWFYHDLFFSHKKKKSIVRTGIAFYMLTFILVTLFVQSLDEYQTLMWIITGMIMIIFSTSYFLYSLSVVPASEVFNDTPVWINSGVLIYFILNLFLFIMSNHVFNKMDAEMSSLIWSFHNVNNIIKNVLFAIGLSFCKRSLAGAIR